MVIMRAMNFGSWKDSCTCHLWKTEHCIFVLGWYLFNVIFQKMLSEKCPCKKPHDLQRALKSNVMAVFDIAWVISLAVIHFFPVFIHQGVKLSPHKTRGMSTYFLSSTLLNLPLLPVPSTTLKYFQPCGKKDVTYPGLVIQGQLF